MLLHASPNISEVLQVQLLRLICYFLVVTIDFACLCLYIFYIFGFCPLMNCVRIGLVTSLLLLV